MKKILGLSFLLIAAWSCSKHDKGPSATLNLSRTTMDAGTIAGYTDTFTVSANIPWKLAITSQGSGWLQLDSTSGSPGKTVVKLTVTAPNITNTSQSATITLSPAGSSANPVQLTVTQRVYKLAWQKALGGTSADRANAIIRTADGGYAVAGYTYSTDGDVTINHGSYDFWVVKLDGNGNKVWQKTLGGSGLDEAYAITATSDGGYVVAGFTTSTDGDVTGLHGGGDMWVVKLDGNGNKLWQKTLGGTNDDNAYAVAATTDGGYVVAGYTYSTDGDVTTAFG